METQSILKIGIPDDAVLRGSEFRERLAKALGNNEDTKKLFHRTSDGKTGIGSPGLRTVSGRSWVGVLAMPGDAHNAVLTALMGQIVSATTKMAGRSVPVEFAEYKFGAFPTEKPVTYYVREMAVKRRTNRRKEMPIEALAKEVIKNGFASIALQYGFDMPDDDVLDLRITNVSKSLGLMLRTIDGTTNEYVQLVDCEFTAFVDLKGYWQVGNLQSRGYGRIVKNRWQAEKRTNGVLE